MSKKQKTWIVGGVSAVVIIGLVLVFLSVRAQSSSSSSTAYQTTTVWKVREPWHPPNRPTWLGKQAGRWIR
jgi:succinate dehydrogenase hydrophobic anchor subunit